MFTVRRVAWAAKQVVTSSYRYWRIQWTAPGSGADGFLDCREIELRGSVGGSDLTSPSTAITNSAALWLSFGSTPGQLVDNNTSVTSTSGYTTNSTTTFDLVTPQSVAEFAYMAATISRAPQGLSIYGSNDGSSFTLLKAYTGISGWSSGVYKTFSTT